jgi:DNA-binding CsgD family transcriptional regulator
MPKAHDFFSFKNTVTSVSGKTQKQTANYLETIKAFARTTYQSVYIIDYQKKGFEYVSDNPLFLCGHTAQEVQNMGYEFYFKCVIEKDLDLLLKINTIGFDFYETIPKKDRKDYSITYDFHLKNQEGKTILINQKLTPLFLNEDGKIWKAICIVSLSNEHNSGNIKIYKKGSNTILEYDLQKDVWVKKERVVLNDREKEIIQLSARWLPIDEIAENLYLSKDTVKFHRRKLFEKLQVTNIAEAIAYVTNNNLL